MPVRRPCLPRRPIHPITPTHHLNLRSLCANSTKHPTPPHHLPSFNLFAEIRRARPAVRYTLYAGFGLMVVGESTFWFNVLRAKFFPPDEDVDRQAAEEFLVNLRAVVKGYRAVWLHNYTRYYGAYLWGLGYGGLDGLEGVS